MRLPDNNPDRSQSNGDTGGVTMTSSNAEPDFSEFMWMAEEDLEAFDHKVITEVAEVLMQQNVTNNGILRDEEEEFLTRMLEEEEQRDTVYYSQYLEDKRRNNDTADLEASMQKMGVSQTVAVAAESTLNPYAAEFVPGQGTSRESNPPDVNQANSQKKS